MPPDAGVDHLGDGVVPQILLRGAPLAVCVRIGRAPCIHRVAAADAGGFHGARWRRGRPGRGDAVHARGGERRCPRRCDAFRRFEDGVDQDRLLTPWLRFELGEELVEIVDVPRAFDLGQHDDVELVAGLRDDLGDVVEQPRRVEAVDARPQAGALAEISEHFPSR
jgi:hypothetical protein